MDVWKERGQFRKRMKRNYLRMKASIRDRLDKAQNEFTFEVDVIIKTLEIYTAFHEGLEARIKTEKVINNFLSDMPKTGAVIEPSELDRHINNKKRKFDEDGKVLREFVQAVKTECVMDQTFFSFFEIPDLIVRKKYTREQYDKIKKLILKVKTSYLKKKAESRKSDAEKKEGGKSLKADDDTSVRKSHSNHNQNAAEVQSDIITDEDLVPLDLLDEALAHKERKERDMKQVWDRYKDECLKELEDKSSKIQMVEKKKILFR